MSISMLPMRAMDSFKGLDSWENPLSDRYNEIPISSFEENEEREQRRVINDKIEKRELERIKSSLKEGRQLDLNVYIGPGKSIMSLAVEHNDIELLELLLDRGADINICDAIGNTALQAAIVKNNNFLCEYLLKKGANPNIKNKIIDNTLLDSAILFKNISAVKLLAQYNADVNKNIATLLIENTHFDPEYDSKKYYLCTKTVLLILNRYNNLVPGIKDLRFLILSYLPYYHEGLHDKLFAAKYVAKPFALNIVNEHINTVQEILQIKSKNNKTALELLPSEVKSLNKKLLEDYVVLDRNYPSSLLSVENDNLAFKIFKKYTPHINFKRD